MWNKIVFLLKFYIKKHKNTNLLGYFSLKLSLYSNIKGAFILESKLIKI